MASKEYFKNARSEAEEQYSNAIGKPSQDTLDTLTKVALVAGLVSIGLIIYNKMKK